ncbi:MAG TPA: carbonic anhydrase [Tepidisphaeraceae bacterium]|jgi:carbonic anhydrase|nr:carbonic anhydrase [Tepidisphaeraceae bacterium]
MQRLVEGNNRFRRGESRESILRREDLLNMSKGQRPYATILGCSDSRVAPEWIFDAALGELFVIRVAGNVISSEIAGSMQYASDHLKTPLFVVLGHEDCGVVKAALDARDSGVTQRSRIHRLVESVLPGIPPPDPSLSPKAQISRAVEANVQWTIKQIRAYPEVKAREGEKNVRLVGAIYCIETGEVRWQE